MPYVGNPLADAFSSRVKQDLTGQSGTSFTLSHAVSHANDLSVYINHVRQEPTTAYSVNGTTLTTTGSVASTDDFYIIYDELAVQSISHPTDQALTATSGTFTSGLVGTTATFSGAVSGTTGTFSSDLTVDSGTLKVDSSNNKVGIGTTSPASQLHIDEGNSNSYATLRLEGNNRGGDIEMYQGTVPVSTIRTDQSGNMYIKTSGAYGSSSLSNKIVLLTGGNVGIGTDSPASPLGANYRALDINSGVWGGTVNFSGNSGGYIGNRHSGNGGLGYYAASGQGHNFHVNGNTTSALNITSSGHVFKPLQPLTVARYAANTEHGAYNAGSNANIIICKPSNVQINQGSHYNVSTGKFTCPVAGTYRVSFMGNFLNNNVSNYILIQIRKNGSSVDQYYQDKQGVWQHVIRVAYVTCAANDTLEVYNNCDSAGPSKGGFDIVQYTAFNYSLVG